MSPQGSRILARIGALRRSIRIALLLAGAGRLLLACLLFMALTLGLDLVFELEQGFRLALLLAGSAAVLLVAWAHLGRRPWMRLEGGELAQTLERAHPFLKQVLVSAHDFAGRAPSAAGESLESPALMARTMAAGEVLARRTRAGRALSGRSILFSVITLAAVLAAFGGMAYRFPDTLGLWARRQLLLADTPWPRRTFLEVLGLRDGVLAAPRGEDLAVLIQARGLIPASGRISWRSDAGASGQEPLTRVGRDRLRHLFRAVNEPLAFHARAGDGRLGPVAVVPVDRPQVEELRLEIQEPEYTRRAPRRIDLLESAGPVQVLLGSRLLFTGRATKELSTLAILVGREERAGALDAADARRFSFALVPAAGLEIEFLPRDRLELAPRPAPRLELQVVPDQDPRVFLAPQGVGAMVTARVRIPLACKAEDDVGLGSLLLEEALAGEAQAGDPPFGKADASGLEQFRTGEPAFLGELIWRAAPGVLEPGKLHHLRACATDILEPPPAHLALSPVLRFKVVDDETLLKELLRRQGEVRAELESMHEALRALRGDLEERPAPQPALPGALQGLAARTAGEADRLRLLLDEWQNNDLPGGEKMGALRLTAAGPLRDLAAPALARARDLAATRLAGIDAGPGALLAQLDQALAVLEAVLRQLARLEDFQRLLEITRSLIRTQAEARDALDRKLKDALKELFGEDQKDK